MIVMLVRRKRATHRAALFGHLVEAQPGFRYRGESAEIECVLLLLKVELAALDIDCAPYDEDRFVEELHAIRAG